MDLRSQLPKLVEAVNAAPSEYTEWIEQEVVTTAKDNIAPSAPTIVATAVDQGVDLAQEIALTLTAPTTDVDGNPCRDFHHFNVYHDGSSGVTTGDDSFSTTSTRHSFPASAQTYFKATAVDRWGNESALSAEVNATPADASPGDYTQTIIDGGLVTTGTIQVKDGAAVTKAGITGSTSETASTSIRIWAGDTYANRATAPFRVTQAGVLYATGATIAGTINASAGTFSGTITSTGTISGGTIQGATLQTASTGERIVIAPTFAGISHAVQIYNSSNQKVAQLRNATGGYLNLANAAGSGEFTVAISNHTMNLSGASAWTIQLDGTSADKIDFMQGGEIESDGAFLFDANGTFTLSGSSSVTINGAGAIKIDSSGSTVELEASGNVILDGTGIQLDAGSGTITFTVASTTMLWNGITTSGGTGSTFNRDGYITVVVGSDTKYIQLYDWD